MADGRVNFFYSVFLFDFFPIHSAQDIEFYIKSRLSCFSYSSHQVNHTDVYLSLTKKKKEKKKTGSKIIFKSETKEEVIYLKTFPSTQSSKSQAKYL